MKKPQAPACNAPLSSEEHVAHISTGCIPLLKKVIPASAPLYRNELCPLTPRWIIVWPHLDNIMPNNVAGYENALHNY